MNLQEYAAKVQSQRRPTLAERWFRARPEICDQVTDAFRQEQPLQVSVVLRWLEEHHGFPYKYTALQRFRDLVKRDAG